MQSKAATVAEYLAELPEERRRAIEAVREVILANLDKDIEEGMSYGMISYVIPHRVFPQGYHCDPKQALPYAGLASQKQYMALYLGSGESYDRAAGESEFSKWFRKEWEKTGKKLDMGKVCIRFKKIEDLPLELIGRAIKRLPAREFIAAYLKSRPEPKPKAPARRKPA